MFILLFERCLRFSFSDSFCARLLKPFCLWGDVLFPLLWFPKLLGLAPAFISEDCIFCPLKEEGVMAWGPGEGEWVRRYCCRTSTFPFAVSFGTLVCLCSSWYWLCKCRFPSICFVPLVGALLPLPADLLGAVMRLLDSELFPTGSFPLSLELFSIAGLATNPLPGSVESI